MLPLASSTALLVLQQADERSRPGWQPLDIVALANGVGPSGGKPSPPVAPVDDMFSVMSVDINEMKIDLMERLGKQLGISLDDFADASGFGRAVERLVNVIRTSENGGDIAIMRIGRELGLDKLGIALDDLVDAINDPEGDADQRLEEALLRETVGEEHAPGRPRIDEIGLYSF